MRRRRKIDKHKLKKMIRNALEIFLEDEVFMGELEEKYEEPSDILKRIERDVKEIIKNSRTMGKQEYNAFIQERVRELKKKYLSPEDESAGEVQTNNGAAPADKCEDNTEN